MKKHLLLLFLLLPFATVNAQDITADTTRASELYNQASHALVAGHYDSAILLYRQALPLYEKHELWEDYYYTGASEIWCLGGLSQLNNASTLGEHYLKNAEERLPKLNRAKAVLLSNLGVMYHYQAQYAKALEHYQKSLNINLELFGEKHAHVANTYMSVAIMYSRLLQYTKALEYYQKSLNVNLALFGEKYVSVANAYLNMASIYQSQSQYKKALEYYQKSLKIDLELFGKKHMNIASAYNNMASVYRKQSQYKKALEFYQKSLRIHFERFGEQHTNISSIYHNMANVYKSQAQHKKALEYYQKGLTIDLELLGEKHTSVAFTYDNIGSLYRDLKQYDSAAHFHHKAVEACAWDFKSDDVSQNPKPEQALEKNSLMEYLQHKAEALTLLGQEENALKTYAVAAACAKLAMQEADREQDKLGVAARAHPVHTQAAYLHFLRAKREGK